MAREDSDRARPRTQSSLAVRAGDGPWYLVNASPDVRQQLESLRDEPPGEVRSSPIAGVLLTDAEIDHTAGLLVLREGAEPLRIFGTEAVRRALSHANPVLRILDAYSGVEWSTLEPGVPLSLGSLEVEVAPVGGDPPNYVGSGSGGRDGTVVALTFRDSGTGAVATYAPAAAELDDELVARLAASDCVLVDGTFWRDDELASLGVSTRTAREMGHVPLSGDGGSLETLARLERPRRILVHINNTNPILLEDSPERRAVEQAGVEVSYDGMNLEV